VTGELGGARIDVVNWRDPWHPQAGGAECYAWQMATAFARAGARVRYVTARAPGQDRAGRHDGVEVIRLGGRFTVYPRVLGWLLARRLRGDAPGLVLDCQNGIPFFTPVVLPRRVPVLCVMHHVHTAQFGVHFPAWMAWTGRLLEGPAARRVYRRHACVAVSPSTIDAMRDRLRWTGDIYLIPNGSPQPADPQPAVSAEAKRLVWVGRLVAHKRAERIVPVAERGFAIDVIGRGPAEADLTDRHENITVHGYLPGPAKTGLVGRSLLHLSTSQGEGWGLSVLEAAALGVPTVAYDVEGLRDSIRDGETGWLVKDGEELADVVERAAKELADPDRAASIAAACRAWSGLLSWPRSTERMLRLAEACLHAGSARGTRHGAWIVAAGTATMVAEGPVLDEMLNAGATVTRPATAAERLLGEPEAGS